jgi:uncharacterized protein (TIGR02594 family)
MIPRWLEHALKDNGIQETPGPKATARVVEALHHTTLPESMKNTDETSNCSAYMCMWFDEVGMKSTRSAAAISWETWGVPLNKLVIGAVVVLDRHDSDNPDARHVTLCHGLGDGKTFVGFGGNQHDECKDSDFLVTKIKAIRWPKDEPLPQ